MALDIRKVIDSIERYESVGLTAYKVPGSSIEGIGKILELYLKKIRLEEYHFQLFYALRELIENAKKANLKRVYFAEEGLDLADRDQYSRGMEGFKRDVYGNIGSYEEKLKERRLFVRTTFEVDDSHFSISIANNVMIAPDEEERIRDRISRSAAFESVEEAFQTVLDSTEGAGLGLVMLVLMLKKIGVGAEAFSIRGVEDTTVATIRLPRHDLFMQQLSNLAGRIEDELERIPQFPEHIIFLQKLLADPEVDFGRLERTISADPGLAAELLRMVNSAAFGINRRVSTISEAISLSGLKGIRDLITAYGTVKMLVQRFGEMKELWNHSYRVAVYSAAIARRYNLRGIYEEIYSSSLLHDLGRVVVDFLSPELFEKLREFSTRKGIPAEEFERFAVGIHHSEIGAQMAERWEYPPSIINTIRYHHAPEMCEERFRDLVDTVYLANFLDDWDRGKALLDHLSAEVINRFALHSRESAFDLLQVLRNEFAQISAG